jgi:hypothetical protein
MVSEVTAQRVIERLCVPEGEKASAWKTERREDHMRHAGFVLVGDGSEFAAAVGGLEPESPIQLIPDGGSFPYSFSLKAEAELAMIDYCEGDIAVRVYDDEAGYLRALAEYEAGVSA